jgi:molybdopterin synthase sulfur carrier subunit
VQVRFYATLRPIVGARSVEIPLPPGASVQTLVDAAIDRHPGLREILRDEHGRVPRGVHVFVNGRGAGWLPDGYATPLADDDAVDIFPAVAGG